jgi:hypothetical protein
MVIMNLITQIILRMDFAMGRATPSFKFISCMAAISVAASSVGGCLLLPEAAPLLGHERKKRILYDVIRGVQCEIRQAVRFQIFGDPSRGIRGDRNGANGKPKLAWFEQWNALIDLDLKIEDKLSFNPGVSLKTPNWVDAHVGLGDYKTPRTVGQSYNFDFGGGITYNAVREDKVTYSYPFSMFLNEPQNGDPEGPCYKIGGITIEADLKIGDWLDDVLEPIKKCAFLGWTIANANEEETTLPLLDSRAIALDPDCEKIDFTKYPVGDPVKSIEHTITFRLSFNANATPTWSLVRVATNAHPLFSADRNDTSTLLMTFGPPGGWKADPTRVSKIRNVKMGVGRQGVDELSAVMLLTHQAQQIRSGILP